jgi:Pyruvate/2-oxoacid:ferredoxin oxidoreductase delta subunit
VENLIVGLVTALVILLAALPMVVRQRRHNAWVLAKLAHARKLGTNETLSLHPVVDEGMCIGCEECVRGCPEQDVLATYHSKAVVIDAIECVGHGICERVCPVGAITLVVGTETRGLELPRLSEVFETDQQGIFVVGELGGMGLIRNAIWQASQAIEYIRQLPRSPAPGGTEVLIVGAGPAGMAAALAAKVAKIPFRIIEQETVGGSMLHYPRRKLVMTHAVTLPGVGPFPFRQVEKEPLLKFWHDTAKKFDIAIEEHTALVSIAKQGTHYVVKTSQGDIPAKRVILALGRRGSPRKLGVPGEDSAKVYYRLIEAHLYEFKKVAVIGGGSAALEAALSLAGQRGAQVTLCHRRDTFAGARGAHRAVGGGGAVEEARGAAQRLDPPHRGRQGGVRRGRCRGRTSQRLRLRDGRRRAALRPAQGRRHQHRDQVRHPAALRLRASVRWRGSSGSPPAFPRSSAPRCDGCPSATGCGSRCPRN